MLSFRIINEKRYWEPELHTMSIDLQIGLILANEIENFGSRYNIEESTGAGERHVTAAALDMFESALVATLSKVHNYLDPKAPLAPDIFKERTIIDSICNIRTELDMIEEILGQQKDMLDQLLQDPTRDDILAEDKNPDKAGWERVKAAESQLSQYLKRVNKIDRDAERIETTMDYMLNLKRTYASNIDTRNGVIVGRAALGFAVITIIFTPLSFLTSLFALSTDELMKHQHNVGSTSVYSNWYIGITFGSYSNCIKVSIGNIY